MEKEIKKLNKEELLQLINNIFDCDTLKDIVDGKYIHEDDINIYAILDKASDDNILEEVTNRYWSTYEANEIYDHISTNINMDLDDVLYHYNQLSSREKRHIIQDTVSDLIDDFTINTLYDEMKAKIAIELYNKLSLEQLEILQKTII